MNKTLEILKFLVSKEQQKKIPLFTLFLIFASALEIGALMTIYPVINIFIDPNYTLELNIFGTIYLIGNSQDSRLLLILFFFLLYIFKAFFLVFFNMKLNRFLTDTISNVNERIYSSYLNLEYDNFLNKNISNTVQIIQQESYGLFFYLRAIITTVVDAVFFISVYLFLLILEPLGTAVLSISLVVLYAFFYFLVLRSNMSWGKERVNSDLNLSKLVIESLGSLLNIRIGNKEEFFESFFIKESRNKSLVHSKQLTYEQMPRFFLEIILLISVVSFIAILNLRNYDQGEFLTIIGILVAASIRLIPSINSVISSISIIKYRYSSLDLVYNELFENVRNSMRLSNQESISFESNLKLTDIEFSYNNNNSKILDKLNLRINKGSFIGIVGESGSGKSTLINLLCGLLSPSSGEIRSDNLSIYQNLRAWQSMIGYVGQKTFLLDESIAANIAFGVKNDEIDYEKVQSCIKAVKLEPLMKKLKLGMDTSVGQDGSKLSGGQKQRIGIARALYSDPSIIIFDEATNSLDDKTEISLLTDITSFKGSKTLLFISHNLNSLEICDEIYELRNKTLIKK